MPGQVVIALIISVLFNSPGGHTFESLSGRGYCCFGVSMYACRSLY
jgi:hypothetical protein